MKSTYQQVIVSLIASLLLLLALLFYQYVFPKKKIHPLGMLILISLLPLISTLRVGTYESGDLSSHVIDSMQFYKSLSEGILFPIWAGEMNASYGYPAFMFIYPLPFYFISLFHFIGFSFIVSTKMILIFAYIFSGIFMFSWLKKELNEKSAIVGSLFYLFAPYHLVDLHFRADIGEVLAFTCMPLSLLAANMLRHTRKLRWFFVESFAIAALILSHPAISFVGVPTIFFYTMFFVKNPFKQIKELVFQMLPIITGVLLTSFYFIPLLYNLRYTFHDSVFSEKISFLDPVQLLYSPWRFGLLFQGPKGELSFLVGYAQLMILGLCIFYICKNRIKKTHFSLIIPSIIIIFVTTIMMLEITKPIWFIIPFMKNFQFSYRLLGITMFAFAVTAAVTINYIKARWVIVGICVFVIFSTILNWGNRRTIPAITDEVLHQNLPFIALHGGGFSQAITIWSDQKNPWATHIPNVPLEVVRGKGKVTQITRKTNYHKYQVYAQTPLVVQENTLYFPAWNVYINGKPQKITILSTSKPKGLISFSIPQGNHIVEVVFQDTLSMNIGKTLSLVTLLLMGMIGFYISRRKVIPTKKLKGS